MLPTFCPPTIWTISLEFYRKPSILAADDFLGACYRKAMTPKKLWTLLFPQRAPTIPQRCRRKRSLSPAFSFWRTNNTQRGIKTDGFQNRKFWGLSKLAILVHQQGTRLGGSWHPKVYHNRWFSKSQVLIFKTSNFGTPAKLPILVHVWVFPKALPTKGPTDVSHRCVHSFFTCPVNRQAKSGRAKGVAKGSCGETVVQKGVFGESVSSLPP